MSGTWLIYNPRSRNCDERLVADVGQLFAEAGQPVDRKIHVGEDDLPDGVAARAAGVETIVTLSGDGTINTVARRLEGWEGTLLALPGGTMNLLAGALHGASTTPEIVAAALAGEGATGPVPVIRVGSETAFAGIIVGPTSAWADVREDMRNLDLKAIGTHTAEALEATFNEPRVGILGSDSAFPAIYLEPRSAGLAAFGVRAESTRDLLAHGWAWLQGDIRAGPGEALDVTDSVTLTSRADSFDMLVDGEQADATNPATFRAELSQVRFFSMLGGARWS